MYKHKKISCYNIKNSDLINTMCYKNLNKLITNPIKITKNPAPPTSDCQGKVTAVAAVMEEISKGKKSNKLIKVLLDSGSTGDLMFHKKGTKMRFPYSIRQVPLSWHTSNGVFLTKGRGEVAIKFFEYSNSKQFLAKPDIVLYDEDLADQPAFDLILGVASMKELGIVLDFNQKQSALMKSLCQCETSKICLHL